MEKDHVILVDENDSQRGIMEKIEAHKKGELHRAFSIIVFNSKGEMLLQRRAIEKYHSGGLWTNTCCSHPKLGENLQESALNRLNEEMGFSCKLEKKFHFIYKAELDHELSEHELDHVFIGYYNENPKINSHEVFEWKYMSINDIQENMKLHPENYTAWFKIIFSRISEYIKKADGELELISPLRL